MATTEHRKKSRRRNKKSREKGLRWTLADAGIDLPEALQKRPRKRHKKNEGKERPSPQGDNPHVNQQPAGVSKTMSETQVQMQESAGPNGPQPHVPPAGGSAEQQFSETLSRSFGGILATLKQASAEMSESIKESASDIVKQFEDREARLREEEKKDRFRERMLDVGQNTVEGAISLGFLYAGCLIVRSVWRGRNAHLEVVEG